MDFGKEFEFYFKNSKGTSVDLKASGDRVQLTFKNKF